MPIPLFDGVCNLCQSSVQFVLARDPSETFRFASLQSPIGEQLAGHFGIQAGDLDTVVLIADGKDFTRPDAALRTAQRLDSSWQLTSFFLIVPRPIRDRVYDFIGKRRYRWFGRKETCWLPDPSLRARFLE